MFNRIYKMKSIKIKELTFKLLLSFLLFDPFIGISQSPGTFIDPRDSQEYRIKTINGNVWMLDNLNFYTDLSMITDATTEHAPDGRFYYINELDSVCPEGWTVSRKEDWLSYFEYLVEHASDTTLRITENDMDEIIEIDHWGRLDVFEEVNPLELKHTGWIEGGVWIPEEIMPPPNANYWVLEPERDELQRTHVHIGTIRIRIHHHKHHLKPNQENKLRRFMVRCVKL